MTDGILRLFVALAFAAAALCLTLAVLTAARLVRVAWWRHVARSPGGIAALKAAATPCLTWGSCPVCGREHDCCGGETVGGHWLAYQTEYRGSCYRLFLCDGCGRLLEKDISS